MEKPVENLLITLIFSTRHAGAPHSPWISGGLFRGYGEVFNRFPAKKDINLLSLHQKEGCVDKAVTRLVIRK